MKPLRNGLRFSIPVALGLALLPSPAWKQSINGLAEVYESQSNAQQSLSRWKIVQLLQAESMQWGIEIPILHKIQEMVNPQEENIDQLALQPYEYGLKNVLIQEWRKIQQETNSNYECNDEKQIGLVLNGLLLELRYVDSRVKKIIEFQIRNNPSWILNMWSNQTICSHIYDTGIGRILEVKAIVKALDKHPDIQKSFDWKERNFRIDIRGITLPMRTTIPTLDKFYKWDFRGDNMYVYLISYYPSMEMVRPQATRPSLSQQK